MYVLLRFDLFIYDTYILLRNIDGMFSYFFWNLMRETEEVDIENFFMVSAFQKLFCQIDMNVSHNRRYDRGVL